MVSFNLTSHFCWFLLISIKLVISLVLTCSLFLCVAKPVFIGCILCCLSDQVLPQGLYLAGYVNTPGM